MEGRKEKKSSSLEKHTILGGFIIDPRGDFVLNGSDVSNLRAQKQKLVDQLHAIIEA